MLIITFSPLINTIASFTIQDNIFYDIQVIKADKIITKIISPLTHLVDMKKYLNKLIFISTIISFEYFFSQKVNK
ncbi:MAG: hypothetical protein EAZ76_10510 [Nostocales cyanobacterium]|nr:MAG: hypothetical protein EAZ76_10510 [Nostocales cyanobacterium]